MRARILLEIDEAEHVDLARDWFARWTKRLTGMSRGGCGCCVVFFVVEGPPEALGAIPPAIRGATPDDQALLGPVENPYPPRAKDRRRLQGRRPGRGS